MSNNRSIDGLKRRTTTPVRPATKRTTTKKRSAGANTKTTAPARHQIGIDGVNTKNRRTAVQKNTRKVTKPVSKPKTIVVEDAETKAVKEFLAEVQDVDPTDLIEVPTEEKGKAWFKQPKQKRMKHDKEKKKRHTKRWIFFAIILLILGGGAFLYWKLNGIYSQINGGNIISAIISPDTPLKKDENGRTNILIFGTEGYAMDDPNYDGGYLTDSMLVLSLDQENGDAKAISLPRDLKTKTCTSTGKLNELFWCEYSNVKKDSDAATKKQYETQGATKLAEAFEEVLGIDVQYFVHLNWQAVIQIVDAIGGIDVVFTYGDQTWDGDEVTIETTDKRGLADGNGRKLFYQYKNGEVTHLTGEWALAVARTRNAHGGYGASGGNFSREYFQQKIIEAIVKKAKQTKLTSDWSASFEILSAVGDNVRTDFQDAEMKTLLKVANTVDFQTIESISLVEPADGSPALLKTGNISGISYVLPVAGVGNYTKIHSYIKKKLSSSFEGEEAQVAVLNGTSAYGVASNERTKLEDAGYTVKLAENAPADLSGFDGVRVYQLTDNKSKTAAALKERYGVDLITDIPESLQKYECDYIVIIGGGYSAKE